MILEARKRAQQDSTATNTQLSSLRLATFRIELRQEIALSFMTNRPPYSLVEYCNIDRSLDQTDDWMWTDRMLAHTEDTLAFCNGGDDGGKTLRRWRELSEYNKAWETLVPPSFAPIYEESPSLDKGLVFPKIWFANDCHGMMPIYTILARQMFPFYGLTLYYSCWPSVLSDVPNPVVSS